MPVTLLRTLPNPEILGKHILEAGSGVTCTSIPPPDLATKIPIFTLYRFGGLSPHPKFLDRASMQLISWAESYTAARELAETARVLFFRAWNPKPWHDSAGVVNRIDETAAPGEFRSEGQPDGVFRFDSTYTFWTRPAG